MYCHNPNATQVKAKFDINMSQCQQYISCCLLDCDQILNLGFLDKKQQKQQQQSQQQQQKHHQQYLSYH